MQGEPAPAEPQSAELVAAAEEVVDPVGQVLQPVEPAMFWYSPIRQFLQEVLRMEFWYWPVGQFLHESDDSYLPASQSQHLILHCSTKNGGEAIVNQNKNRKRRQTETRLLTKRT
jgi:hypothetical protein